MPPIDWSKLLPSVLQVASVELGFVSVLTREKDTASTMSGQAGEAWHVSIACIFIAFPPDMLPLIFVFKAKLPRLFEGLICFGSTSQCS